MDAKPMDRVRKWFVAVEVNSFTPFISELSGLLNKQGHGAALQTIMTAMAREIT